MAFSSFNAQPERTKTPPFLSFFRLEPAMPHTHAHVPHRTTEVWLLTGFNFLNGTPHTRSIEGTYGLLQFQVSTPMEPHSTIFVIFSVRTCTAPHTRTSTLLDPGGLVSHGFQLFEQETPYPIDRRYLWHTGRCPEQSHSPSQVFVPKMDKKLDKKCVPKNGPKYGNKYP